MALFPLVLVRCSSGGDESGAGPNPGAAGKELEIVKENVKKLKETDVDFQGMIAGMKAELHSMREQLDCTRSHIETLRRGIRSGIFENSLAQRKIAPKKHGTPLPQNHGNDKDLGDCHGENRIDLSGMLESKNSDLGLDLGRDFPSAELKGHRMAAKDSTKNEEASLPAQMLADAQLKLNRGSYGEAIALVSEVQKKFPKHDDGGLGALILAESWLKLGEHENVFPVLRGFYLKHPQSPDFLSAKLTEGLALEGSGARERAAGVYREIIALGPETLFANSARKALQRMRDAR
jgi:TolA-binding protein